MTVGGPQTPAVSPTAKTANLSTMSLPGATTAQHSTRSFLNELARAVSAQAKAETKSTQSTANTSTAVRSGVFSPASIGAAAPAVGATSASSGKATAKRRSVRKKASASPSRLS